MGQEFVRGAVVRQGVTGTDIVTAMIGLVMRSRRRYGGYVVHLGIVLMMLGFAGAGYRQTEQVLLSPGESVEVGRFAVRHDRLSVTDDGAKEMHTAHVTVLEDGREVGAVVSGPLVLPQVRGGADDRGGDAAAAERGRVRGAGGV